jgi:glycerol uptake facilitator-like aquaporin
MPSSLTAITSSSAAGCSGMRQHLAHARRYAVSPAFRFRRRLLPFQLSTTARTGLPQWLAEFVATFGLLITILGCVRFRPDAVAFAVGLYITSAYWFTASTSFANPAVTIARSLSDTFAGIAPWDVPGFIVAQVLGALAAAALGGWLFA